MSDREQLLEYLKNLSDLLDQYDDRANPDLAAALSGSEDELVSFLKSNALWGGPGSIADQVGMGRDGKRKDGRREIEAELIRLGEEQIHLGIVNPRTKAWVAAFIEWNQKGI
jgi:hypothetical protein